MNIVSKSCVAIAVVSALLLIVLIESSRPSVLGVHFLDVGQGDAICIETPGGRQVLIDGGSGGGGVIEEMGICASFIDRSLDILVATHMDEDHVGGLLAVLERYEVDTIIASHNRDTQVASSFTDAVEAEGARLIHPNAGTRVQVEEGVLLDILAPTPALASASDNERSVVLKLSFHNDTFLFTGDIERRGEYALLASGVDIDSDVLKVAHHGSDSSSTEQFLAAVTPRIAVVQVGKNSYGHPATEVLARLGSATILRNDENGTVSLYSDGDSF